MRPLRHPAFSNKIISESDRLVGLDVAFPWLPDSPALGGLLLGRDERKILRKNWRDAPSAIHDALTGHLSASLDGTGIQHLDTHMAMLKFPQRAAPEPALIAWLRHKRWDVDDTDPPPLKFWLGTWITAPASEVICADPELPIPDALRTYREKLGLSQSGLADRWNMSIKTLKQWEHGTRKPSPEGTIRRLMCIDR